MDSKYKLMSELLSDQAAFITSPKQVWQIIGGGIAPPQCLRAWFIISLLSLFFFMQESAKKLNSIKTLISQYLWFIKQQSLK